VLFRRGLVLLGFESHSACVLVFLMAKPAEQFGTVAAISKGKRVPPFSCSIVLPLQVHDSKLLKGGSRCFLLR